MKTGPILLLVFGYLEAQKPPKILPLTFGSDVMVEGTFAQVSCIIATGDEPLSISWDFQGSNITSNQEIMIIPLGTRASLLAIPSVGHRHRGNYTCRASNLAGTQDQTVELRVIVSPKILPLTFGSDVINEGDFAQLSCIITRGDEPISISWDFQGSNIKPEWGFQIIPIGKRTSLLMIPSVTHRHRGNYTCRATNLAGTQDQTVELTVNVPPRWIVEPIDEQFAQGSDAQINCEADGFPKPHISWKKAATGAKPENYQDLDMQVQSNVKVISGSLVLKNIQKSNEGYYLCKTSNGIGRGLSAVIYISVQDPPHFEIKSRSQTALKGDSTEIHCEAKGEKPIGILWNMNNKRLDANVDPRYTIREEILSDGVLSTISIKRSERGDSGLFTCVATNAFGSDDTSINLIIQEKALETSTNAFEKDNTSINLNIQQVPQPPYGLKVLEKSGRNVKLSWQAPYNGNSNLTRYLIEYKYSKGTWQNDIDRVLVGGDETIAGVFSLRPATSYHFRIVAQNEIGSSGPSDTVTIETSEEKPDGPPVDVRLAAVDQHTLRVNWKAPLKEHWNGAILGYYVGYKKTSKGDDKPYLWETVEFVKERGTEHTVQISNLEVFTEYAIVVQAFNKIGQGPMSEEAIMHTAEGAPSIAPQNIKLTVLSSQTIHLSWSSPPLSYANGIIKGYKIVYGPSKTWYYDSTHNTKIATRTESEIHGLEKYTNYSMQVLAYTNGGDGVPSAVFTAVTDPDLPGDPSSVIALATSKNAFESDNTSINLNIQQVPQPPYGLKVLEKSGRNVKLSWEAPYNGNSNLTRYLIEYKGTWQCDIDRVLVGGDETIAGIFSLRPATTYHFRIVAHNEIGSSGPSDTVTIETSEERPDGPPIDVRLAAVDQHTLRVNWKAPLREHWNGAILGYYVGYKKTSKGDDKPYVFETVEFIKERGTEHTLQISNLEVFTEYAIVVQAFNKIGQGPMSEEAIMHTAK